jgi:futalosine hydrolase
MSGLLGCCRVLVMTAVDAERDAVVRGLRAGATAHGLPAGATAHGDPVAAGVIVEVGGVGVAAAAAATARHLTTAALHGQPFEAVLSAGVAGGFADRVRVGAVALADRSIAADLGAESPDGFRSLDQLGFGATVLPVHPLLLGRLRDAVPEAVSGPVLTVSTVTGTADTAGRLAARYPPAVAEAMEGFGVATAAATAGLPFAEVRAISNVVGPRDRAAWRIGEALRALSEAFAAMAAAERQPMASDAVAQTARDEAGAGGQ